MDDCLLREGNVEVVDAFSAGPRVEEVLMAKDVGGFLG
jgi:hypothetical protein